MPFWSKTGVPKYKSDRECSWPYLIDQHSFLAKNERVLPILSTLFSFSPFVAILYYDLTAIQYFYSMPRGYRSRHRDTHEIVLSVLYLGLGSRVWLQYCIILNSVLKLVCVRIDVIWFIVASRTGRSCEKHLSWARVRYRTYCWRH